MAFRHRFTAMCDEVRQENNGKILILGMYTPNMGLVSLPAVIPALTFVTWMDADRLGSFTQRMSLQNLETGRIVASGNGNLEVQPQPGQNQPWMVLSVVGFRNVMIDRAGSYTFTLNLEGQADPIVHQFDITLNLPQVLPGMPMRR